MLAAALRYRRAAGLHRALRIWGAALVGYAVAIGLKVEVPLGRWGREWLASRPFDRAAVAGAILAAIALAVQAPLRHAMRRYGHEQIAVLPLTLRQRFAIDFTAVSLFLLPPHVALLGIAAAAAVVAPSTLGPPVSIIGLAGLAVAHDALQVALLDRPRRVDRAAVWLSFIASAFMLFRGGLIALALGYVLVGVTIGASRRAMALAEPYLVRSADEPRIANAARRESLASPALYETRWLLRGNARRIMGANATAVICIVAAELAIRNNGVIRFISTLRILFLFAALAAGAIAVEIVRARNASRPLRLVDAVLPLSAVRRLMSLLAATTAFLIAPAVAAIIMEPRAAVLVIAQLIAAAFFVVLLGEHRSLRTSRGTEGEMYGAAAALAIVGALSPFVALAVAALLVPLSLHLARTSHAHCDLPVDVPEGFA
ncbi:MAG TPA: hypothetical protein VEZ11_14910 [Thermoanaerobaculia bacterium]|nr:hypothetical protein [Thermoanaerobaculia bacterium]